MQSLKNKMETPVFTISRLFDASRERLWQAWTTPELMAKWWGPKGFTVVEQKLDLRPGGSYLYALKGPDGNEMWGKFNYREVTSPEKLVFANHFSDKDGGMTRHPFAPNWPLELLSTITFTPHGEQTEVRVEWTPLNANDEELRAFAEGMGSMQQGWGGTFDQLGEFIAASR